MHKFLLLLAFIQIASMSISQTITPDGIFSAGDTYISSDAQISWTLGDIQTSVLRGKDNILTQGLIQGHFIVEEPVGIAQFTDYEDLKVKVFPNPVQDILNINYSSNQPFDMRYELYNIEGKKIYSDKIPDGQNSTQIQFEGFQSGYYILKVLSEDNKFYKTYKVFYQN